MSEFDLIARLMGAGGAGWMGVAIFAAFVIVAVWKSDRIANPYLFRCAAVLFAVSVALPGAFQMLMLALSGAGGSAVYGGVNRSGGDFAWMFVIFNGLTPFVHGLCVFLLIFSILPSMAVSPYERDRERRRSRDRDRDRDLQIDIDDGAGPPVRSESSGAKNA